jgi:hypothetical protein
LVFGKCDGVHPHATSKLRVTREELWWLNKIWV